MRWLRRRSRWTGTPNVQELPTGTRIVKSSARETGHFPVSDTFLGRFMAQSATPQPSTPPPPSVTNVSNNVVVALKSDAADIRGMMALFQGMIDEQKKMNASESQEVARQTIAVLTGRVKELEGQFSEKTTQLSGYSTSIKPNDPDLQITARRASELFPKIPYYIPGTTDTGEFWLEPTVSDGGELIFNLRFIDVKSMDRTRETVALTSAQLTTTRDALRKIVEWSKTAHENAIRKDFSRRAACFPTDNCPPENGKVKTGASTEIIFRIYEDGSTAGRVQRNKGQFESGYNISVDSSLLLQAYLNHILLEGEKELAAGSRNATQLNDLFK